MLLLLPVMSYLVAKTHCANVHQMQSKQACCQQSSVTRCLVCAQGSHLLLCTQVGSDPTEAEVQAVKQYVQQHRSEVKVVQANWLRSCGDQRSLLAAANGYLVPLDTLTAPQQKSASPDNPGQQSKAEAAGSGQGGENGGANVGLGLASGGENGGEAGAVPGSQAPKHQALKGFW